MPSQLPYVGLRPLVWDESDIFFGRQTCTDELIQLLAHTNFLTVLGEAYCGKTSLMHCGIRTQLQHQDQAHWHIATMRPDNDPFAQLTAALLAPEALGELYQQDFKNDTVAGQFLKQNLTESSFGLQHLLDYKPLPDGHKLLIICDQFEEMLHYQQAEPVDAKAFVNLLLDSTKAHPVKKTPQTTLHILLVMRSSYLDQCAVFPELAQAIKQRLYLLPRLNNEQLYEVITKPALVHDGIVSEELAQQLLREAQNKGDQLLLLQHLLMRMWELVPLGLPHHLDLLQFHKNKITSLEQALSAHLEDAYFELRDQQCKIAEILFQHLVVTNRHENHRLHKSVSLESVAVLAQVPWQEVAEVVKVFRRSPRNFLLPDTSVELRPHTPIEISHDAVVLYWHRLEEWRLLEIEAGVNYRRMQEKAQQQQQDKTAFLSITELMQTWQWYREDPPSHSWAQHYRCDLNLIRDYIIRSVIYRAVSGVLLIGLFSVVLVTSLGQWHKDVDEKEHQQQLLTVFSQLSQVLITPTNAPQITTQLGKLVYPNPDNADAWFYYGVALSQQQKWQPAALAFRQAQTLTPQNILVLFHLGFALQQLRQWQQAIQVFELALIQQPGNGLFLHHLADTFVEANQLDKAVVQYRLAVKAEPKNDIILGKLAQVLNLQNHTNEAKQYFNQALAINKNNDANWRNLGLLYKKQRDLKRAEFCFWQAVRVNARQDMNLRNLGSVLIKQNKLKEAIQIFSQATQVNPHHDKNWLNLGDALNSDNNLDEALKAYYQAVKIQPSRVNLTHLADLLHKQNKVDEAINYYRQALLLKTNTQ